MLSVAVSGKTNVSMDKFVFFGYKTAALNCSVELSRLGESVDKFERHTLIDDFTYLSNKCDALRYRFNR